MAVLVAVTDHAVERFRQRIGGRAGELRPSANEAVVVTLWEAEGGAAPPRVGRKWTDSLRRGSG